MEQKDLLIKYEQMARKLALEANWGAEAVEINKKIIAIDTQNSSAYTRLANCYREHGLIEEAIDIYYKVLSFDGGNNIANNRLFELEQRHKQRLIRSSPGDYYFPPEHKIEQEVLFDISVKDNGIPWVDQIYRSKLLNIQKNQESKIREILLSRNISYLFHFTRIENLASILENGLLPVSLHTNRGINSFRNDYDRVDAKWDCTSCSVSFPNYKLFYHFREHKYPDSTWVIIRLKPEILFSLNNISYFCYTNAAGIMPRVSTPEILCTANSFENMFWDTFTKKNNEKLSRSDLKIKSSYTTDPQAEILISDIIDPQYIDGVCFNTDADINKFFKKHGLGLFTKTTYRIDPSLFYSREDYKFW